VPTKEVEVMPVVKPVPDDYPRVVPYLSVIGASDAIDFYRTVFGARERMRLAGPEGKVGHAELEIGDSVVMVADESPEMGGRSPKTLGGTPVTLMVYVEDVDDVFARALHAGATEVRAVQDQFYGDRSGMFEDPFGHRWNVATHIEDVSAQDMEQRAAEAAAG
jgi:PhnB protein